MHHLVVTELKNCPTTGFHNLILTTPLIQLGIHNHLATASADNTFSIILV